MEQGTITYDDQNDNMTCACGNRSHMDGFVSVDEDTLQECEPDEHWQGRYMCQTCGATFVIYSPHMPSQSPADAPPKFVAVRKVVMRGKEHICTAVSGNMAQRIARALNRHTPNERGQ